MYPSGGIGGFDLHVDGRSQCVADVGSGIIPYKRSDVREVVTQRGHDGDSNIFHAQVSHYGRDGTCRGKESGIFGIGLLVDLSPGDSQIAHSSVDLAEAG